MKSLGELWERIVKLKEDLEKLGCDVTVKAGVRFEGPVEGSYAELGARLREAFKDLEAPG